LLVASAIGGGAWQHLAANSDIATVQTVTISAQRMTEAQKLAYDLEQSSGAQTVVLSAKRPSAEQKQVWLEEERKQQMLAAGESGRHAI
jgi:hypothetical protein